MLTCERCAGRKEVLALGGLRKKCLECKGTGFVSQDKGDVKNVVAEVKKERKPYVRKKKVIADGSTNDIQSDDSQENL